MYGGRISLFIGIVSALITTVLAVVFGLLAGFYGGKLDSVIGAIMDVIWAFPVLLLGIALGTALSIGQRARSWDRSRSPATRSGYRS